MGIMNMNFSKSKLSIVMNTIFVLVLIGLVSCLFIPFSLMPIDFLHIASKQKNSRYIVCFKNESGFIDLVIFKEMLDGTENGMNVSANDKPVLIKNEFAPYTSANFCYINIPNTPWHKFQFSYRHAGVSSFAWAYSSTFVVGLPIWFLILSMLVSRWIFCRMPCYFKTRRRGFELVNSPKGGDGKPVA